MVEANILIREVHPATFLLSKQDVGLPIVNWSVNVRRRRRAVTSRSWNRSPIKSRRRILTNFGDRSIPTHFRQFLCCYALGRTAAKRVKNGVPGSQYDALQQS